MVVRIRLKIRVEDRELEAASLVKTGFETETPQLLVPNKVLQRLGLLERLQKQGEPVEYGTAGGPTVMYVLRSCCTVSVSEPDRIGQEVRADLVASPVEREVIISDALAEALGISILGPKSGVWRFADEERTRQSYPPQYW
jgi:hypothetical protein